MATWSQAWRGVRDPKHLVFIRSLPCLVCGNNTSVEAAHVRYAEAKAGKSEMGMGRRSDCWVVPLCGNHHRKQHLTSERGWWTMKGVDPVYVAMALYCNSDDYEAAQQIIRQAR